MFANLFGASSATTWSLLKDEEEELASEGFISMDAEVGGDGEGEGG